ncbi:hypothetical protein P8C59_009144 [Phyllachora maydis]|uniref:chitinase n=1 Tax=Phyllachora maydis TaxID=1825666 RepID=A0AAD9ICX1_9PEZI|nr:hypothetical protein P8C59_009144 [Phyllachora maydis]
MVSPSSVSIYYFGLLVLPLCLVDLVDGQAATLVYNCAKLPSICRNVNSVNPLQAVIGNTAAGNLGLLDPGQTPGGLDYLTLTLYVLGLWLLPSSRPLREALRSSLGRLSAWSSGWAGQRFVQNGVTLGMAGYNVIANQANTGPSGAFWSCDEWPPATTTNGGIGAQTYCAPQNYKCSSTMRALGAGMNGEQDIQGNSHNILRTILQKLNPGQSLINFKFQTTWQDDDDVPGAYVEWTEADGEYVNNIFSRADDVPLMRYALFFSNGSIQYYARPMTVNEMHEKYSANSTFSTVVVRDELTRDTPVNGQSSTSDSLRPTNRTVISPVRQQFDRLAKSPPLPMVEMARSYIQKLGSVHVVPYLNQVLSLLPSSRSPQRRRGTWRRSKDSVIGPVDTIFTRQKTDQCSASSPCPDGSCCNNQGGCGYGPANCGDGNCTNTCDATAFYYGYCGTGSDFCSSPQPDAPCQAGFGSCDEVAAPTCGGSSASGRSMAYYQVSNSYSRECQRISPSQIDTTGLTHLILAFVSIDPTSFEIVPVDSRDVPLYSDFTARKSDGLQTWVSVGGWDFNDPGPTQTTFSDMAGSAAHRARFIASAESFMQQYGFQGIDIDWEYPGAPDRAGQSDDTANFVTLLQEMKAAYGSSYGISATIPASYWYLRWFDPLQMQPYVDFFNLLSYDLHGPWDKTVVDIGPVILGQTNIPELYNWTLPLWYAGVDPGKINMGLAYYGRGYTVANVDCTEAGCGWSGTSRPAPCTNFGGVMSLEEMQQIVIPEVAVEPILDSNAMMKYLVWADQWVGYDDLETIAMKKTWASSHCFGGTVLWSIDLYSGVGSGNTPDGLGDPSSTDPGGSGGNSGGDSEGDQSVVYIDPSIWAEPEPVIQCEPPCTFVLPPRPLPTRSTVTFPLYTTSLDVAWSTSTGWTRIRQTTTLTIPPLVVTEIPVWAYTVTDTDTATVILKTFYITESIRPPPFTITDDANPLKQSGVTHPPVTRTITPPPSPYSFTRTSSSTVVAGLFPVVTYKPGKPGPICKSGCGTPCLLFCHEPCLLDCTDGGNDFPDPEDPDPPKRPTPTEETDPTPTGQATTLPAEPTDTAGDEPGNEEEEDDDDQCAFEFGLPAPTLVDPNFGATGTQTLSKPAPAPTPAPPPDPAPPGPNPDTESLHCYNSGASTSRGSMIDGVNGFCDHFGGRVLDASDAGAEHTLTYTLDNIDVTGGTGAECVFSFGLAGCWEYLTLQVTVTNGCRFTVDGPAATDDCGRIFRQAIDQCDTSSTQYKQGGTVTSNCAVWRIDPNVEL